MEVERENDVYKEDDEDEVDEELDFEEDDEGEGDEVEDEEDPDQTGFLLARLQELKAWQAEQERRLIREQQREMEHIQKRAASEGEPILTAELLFWGRRA